ncbi:hypothetical protein BH23CHL1_BH23CHL1_10980 [soil metagenome]
MIRKDLQYRSMSSVTVDTFMALSGLVRFDGGKNTVLCVVTFMGAHRRSSS